MQAATLLGFAGCHAHLTGMVEAPADEALRLKTSEGRAYRLVLPGDAAPVAKLDGFFVEVEGQRMCRTIRVADWEITQGLHGMSVWVGKLEERGIQLGMDDRNSGAFYFLDESATKTLRPYVGRLIVLEGYVVGPHRVKVMYYLPLE